jgi:hypothetical protein
MAAGQHRDGAGRQTGAMGGGVDAARQARYGAEACRAQVARQPLSEFDAGRRSVARADDGDQRPRQHGELAAHREQRRRVVDHLQARRIIQLAERDEVDAARAAFISVSASSREQIRAGADVPPRRPSTGSAPP